MHSVMTQFRLIVRLLNTGNRLQSINRCSPRSDVDKKLSLCEKLILIYGLLSDNRGYGLKCCTPLFQLVCYSIISILNDAFVTAFCIENVAENGLQ